MASAGAAGKPRAAAGARPLSALIASVARPALRSRSAVVARLIADWPDIVGPTLAAQTLPRRLHQGTLTLACSGPVALELQHLSASLAERINAHAGQNLVQQFRFVQAEPPPRLASRRAKRPVPKPVPIPDMQEGSLRDALATLAALVAAETEGPADS